MSIPAKDTHLVALNHHLRAVAIVFDFVNPVLARWRLLDRRSNCGWMNLRREFTRNIEPVALVKEKAIFKSEDVDGIGSGLSEQLYWHAVINVTVAPWCDHRKEDYDARSAMAFRRPACCDCRAVRFACDLKLAQWQPVATPQRRLALAKTSASQARIFQRSQARLAKNMGLRRLANASRVPS
jgi:hypothetical protein